MLTRVHVNRITIWINTLRLAASFPDAELKCMRSRYKCYDVINDNSICVNYYVLLQI